MLLANLQTNLDLLLPFFSVLALTTITGDEFGKMEATRLAHIDDIFQKLFG